jgi:predicted  nucleic acid-binding Zn-ribbon protein
VADAEIFQALMRYHREVMAPELDQRFGEQMRGLRKEAQNDLDGIYKNFDIIRTEVTLLRGAVREAERRLTAVEARLDAIDKKLDGFALRSELNELREQSEAIQQRIAEIESLLNEH